MKKFTYSLVVVFCGFSLLSHAAKLPQQGYIDPYLYIPEDNDNFIWIEDYIASETPSEDFAAEKGIKKNLLMRTASTDGCSQMAAECPTCYAVATALYPCDTSDINFLIEFYDCVDDGNMGTPGCYPDKQLPVGSYFSLLLFAVCYGIYAYSRKNILKPEIKP